MNNSRQQTVLGVFVKHPVPGKVKSRLGSKIGHAAAARLYEAFVADTIDRLQKSANRLIIGYSPNNLETSQWLRQWESSGAIFWPQPAKNLGQRMADFFKFACVQPETKSAILIGSDSPSLPVVYLEQAYEWLDAVDCVIGPSADGGYYLIGLSSPQAGIFEDIQWSSAYVLEETIERINRLGLSMKLLPLWYDVDELDNLRMLRGHLQALKHSGQRFAIKNWRVAGQLVGFFCRMKASEFDHDQI